MQGCTRQKLSAICGHSACDPHRVFAAGVRPPVEPAVARDRPSKPASASSECHRSARATHSVIVDSPRSPRTESVSVCATTIPVGALVDAGLALDPAAVRLLDVVARGREDVEDQPAAGQQQRRGRRRAPRAAPRPSPDGDRHGTGTSRAGRARPPAAGAGRRAGGRAARRRRPPARAAAQTSSIPAEESTPITCTPAAAVGIAIRPVPTPSSTTGPPEASASST